MFNRRGGVKRVHVKEVGRMLMVQIGVIKYRFHITSAFNSTVKFSPMKP